MRYAILLPMLAAAGLFVGGCNASMPSAPSTPAAPSKPAMPAAPATPAAPSKPTTPAAPATPAATPQAPAAPSSPAVVTSKVSDPAAKAVDRTPIKADLSKIKFTAEPAELFGWDDGESRAFFLTNGFGEVVVKVPEDGEYEIVISASCQAAKGENAKFKLKVDGVQVGAETQLKAEDAKDYSFAATLKAGDRKIGAEFTNDLYKEGEYDMNFFLNGLKVVRK
jgi:hypothetical protein